MPLSFSLLGLDQSSGEQMEQGGEEAESSVFYFVGVTSGEIWDYEHGKRESKIDGHPFPLHICS